MSRYLIVGIATLDIINRVPHYPHEDEELRAISQIITAGGNACNTSRVLSYLGCDSSFMGVIADEPDGHTITKQLTNAGVKINSIFWQAQGKSPTSYITVNEETGSRTIVHYRDLNELSYDAFIQCSLDNFSWVHFEGRNIPETRQMLARVKKQHSEITVSVEIEKNHSDILSLLDNADIAFFSRSYVEKNQYDVEGFLSHMHKLYTDKLLVCAWGDVGAYCISEVDGLQFVPAQKVEKVVDTLGAGDTFNAAMLKALGEKKSAAAALCYAVEVAGKKVQSVGFDALKAQ